jgi:tRNA pseudouridine38-40 synthase
MRLPRPGILEAVQRRDYSRRPDNFRSAPLRTWKLTVEYDGSRYSGWAEQINARTIMGELRLAAEAFFGRAVELGGAGRTDAGVHATGQVAHLRVDWRGSLPPLHQMMVEINEALPYDIAVTRIEEAPPRFHARHDALSRAYVYRIARQKDAFSKKFVWWVKLPLNVAAMREACALLAGRHDFVLFRAADPARPDESTLVEVISAEIEEQERMLLFRIEASHFLWRMVRRVTGALVKVGLGELTVDEFRRLVNAEPVRRADLAAWTAPGAGLFLDHVTYPDAASPAVPAGSPAAAMRPVRRTPVRPTRPARDRRR